MAGGEAEDNPLPVNVVPMVDVIFCLCVFFMCCFRFKQEEGKLDCWLPKDKGVGPGEPAPLQEMRVALTYDVATQRLTRHYLHRQVADDAELEALIQSAHADLLAANRPQVPLIIDGQASVPWMDVMAVVNIGKRLEVQNLEFALAPAPGEAR